MFVVPAAVVSAVLNFGPRAAYSFALTAAADIICQALEISYHRSEHMRERALRQVLPMLACPQKPHAKERTNCADDDPAGRGYSLWRTLRYGVAFGVPYAFIVEVWPPLLEHLFPGHGLLSASCKTVLDCGLYPPLFWPPQMLVDHLLEGESLRGSIERMRTTIVPMWKWSAYMWVPLDFLCYSTLSIQAQTNVFWQAVFFVPGIVTCFIQHRLPAVDAECISDQESQPVLTDCENDVTGKS
eukprot:TRINITY_DN12552_c0_g1_i1.p1 TRINITY_DN12552_c0_g1~~TRINITY_DN12552_c0_g1_i1.p1  ORF type:complete len:255 (-),score=23.70 TRINITY_DN12552_c0_g1_i1:8-733(-)